MIRGRGVYGQAQESEGYLQDMVEVRGEGRGDVCIMEVASGWHAHGITKMVKEQGWQGSGTDAEVC